MQTILVGRHLICLEVDHFKKETSIHIQMRIILKLLKNYKLIILKIHFVCLDEKFQ